MQFGLLVLLDGPSSGLEDGYSVDVVGDVGVVYSPDVSVDGLRIVSLSAATWCELVDVVCELVLEDASSDNMGNNEFKDEVLPIKEGTSLTKFPRVKEERVAFVLYHMNITPEGYCKYAHNHQQN